MMLQKTGSFKSMLKIAQFEKKNWVNQRKIYDFRDKYKSATYKINNNTKP